MAFFNTVALLNTRVAVILLALISVQAVALPQYDEDQHLGVASCASSVCHGKSKAVEDKNVMLNEYRIWSTEDRHARAYKTLLSSESKRIAKNLGLPSAHTAKICLDCHTDNVAKEQRGPKFQINDGVACEACHGGSQQWIESHTEEGVTHQQNLDKNMYPTEDGVARAKLCISCHYGTSNKMASHEIMGAGHPRLSFELETFSANQPAHFTVDADYKTRKPYISGFKLWVVGQVEMLKSSLNLMQEKLVNSEAVVPELFFYDCHACHHAMSDTRWQPTSAKKGMPPGAVRLNDASAMMLLSLLDVIAPEQHKALKAALIALHKASLVNRPALNAAIIKLQALVLELDGQLVAKQYTDQQLKAVRNNLLAQASLGEYRDFVTAEQAFLAIESITISLQQGTALETQLNLLYGSLENEALFSPLKFQNLANQIKKAFK
ncbi:multiheme c-type cytochrome [Dasania marina]|uniref:multiheme c-type cytochrome n=1 Tax=Dasania marina TaxID=471499 RepID=UPI0003709BD4|nr:multiheme c-type cytochrome [Dasania marina]